MAELGNCISCDAPAIGSVNDRGFCKDHIDDVIGGTVKPVMDAYRKARAAPNSGTIVPNEGGADG